MARKKEPKLPTGEKLAVINGVLRALAMCDIFVGDRTVIRLTQDLPLTNVDGKVVHTVKAGECVVATVRRYDFEAIVPNPHSTLRMTWLPSIEVDACEVVPQTAEEQQNMMLTYRDVDNENGPRITQQVNAVYQKRPFDIHPVIE